ncbi:scyllo-inositol 2-dehydrogenase (NADP+) [Abditibacterium utsteinense]|uniref:Scyllo-inositol 2-dehydrogenase (NADP+) n=1 Tax=Abditibacterium utsteinense TaxID=1960156 RepID=A0A2S8SR87_9BACT|nr:Gfo/Idh/MocA family oxidoreductase [Abditibacterium utsteinense]PQV63307.1 scyllo-inositol 2-dehydrogenase (NADP+) [Abditibacterium utsteinense]
MKTTKIAVVGYGRWGRVCHIPLILQVPELELVGVASGDAAKREQIRTELGVRAFQNLDEVLADESVEAVVLATPNDTHESFAVRALDAGRHVVTDKPMCLSLSQCDAMMAAAKRNGKVLEVFQNRRRDGDFLTLQNLISSGEMGELRWAEMAWQGFSPSGGWRGQTGHGGGQLFDLGAHLIDQLLLLFPFRLTSVFCRMHHDFPQSEVESEALVVLGFENGATGIADVSSLASISKPRFYARGTLGTFQKFGLDPQEDALTAGDINLAVENPQTFGRLVTSHGERTVETQPGRWRDFYENFARVLAGEAKPLVPIEDSRRLIQVLDAARASARLGQVVRL